MMPQLKQDVSLTGLTPQCVWAMVSAFAVWTMLFKSPMQFVVTSVADSTHKGGSLHYQGNAFDLRVRDPMGLWAASNDQIANFVSQLRASLNDGFDVVIESDHVHVEWQPKKPV